MLLAGEDWQARFRDFRSEVWRLETLPQYLVPQEAEEFARFRAGERDSGPVEDEWTRLIRSHTEAGRTMGRVHIITRPLSDYLQFEFQYYVHSSTAGEDIRILDVTDRESPLPNVQDFWMFDRSTVVLMNYEPDGKQINREVFEGDPEPFREAQRIAVAESIPFSEYVKKFGV